MSGFPRKKRYNSKNILARMIICVKAVMISVMAVFIYDFSHIGQKSPTWGKERRNENAQGTF